jgi:virginiamycin A acetyltransferase
MILKMLIILTNIDVIQDVEPYTNVDGNSVYPFSKEHIEILLELKWWDWEIERITRSIQFLAGNNAEALRKLINE